MHFRNQALAPAQRLASEVGRPLRAAFLPKGQESDNRSPAVIFPRKGIPLREGADRGAGRHSPRRPGPPLGPLTPGEHSSKPGWASDASKRQKAMRAPFATAWSAPDTFTEDRAQSTNASPPENGEFR